MPLSEAVRRLDRSGRLPASVAAVTFDDGFASVLEHALPSLRRHGVPATVFVVARTVAEPAGSIDWIDGTVPSSVRTLSPDEVLALRDAGLEIGSHGFSHRPLIELGDADCRDELRRSREVLEALIGRPVRFLAYPRGGHDQRVRRAAERAGFTHAFALPVTRERAGRYSIPRVGIYRANRLPAVVLKSQRWYLAVRTSALWRRGPGPRPQGASASTATC